MREIVDVEKTKITLSGNLRETNTEISKFIKAFKDTGYEIRMAGVNTEMTGGELIKDCDYFVPIVGIDSGVIRLPSGDSLPQNELNFAIKCRKKILPLIKSPDASSPDEKQEWMRRTLKSRYGRKILSYNTQGGFEVNLTLILSSDLREIAKVLMPMKGFVSYAHADRSIVSDLVRDVQKAGNPLTVDEQNFRIGANISDTIYQAISETGYVILCLSQHAFESEWVRKEIRWALETSFQIRGAVPFILPVKVGPFDWPDEFVELSNTIYADVYSNYDSGMAKLLASISE